MNVVFFPAASGIFSFFFLSGYPIAMGYEVTQMHARVGMAVPVGSPPGFHYAPNDVSPIETVRTFFPETWIWDLVEVG